MRLTVFSDYTLRVLIYLGVRGDELSTISEIAEAYGISRNHLMKVVHHLAQSGYVETTRGKGGGLRLAIKPAEINVGAVVRVTEGNTAIVECFDAYDSACRIQPACVLRGVFHQAVEAFFQVLDRYTVADLVRPQQRLVRLLLEPKKATARALGGKDSRA